MTTYNVSGNAELTAQLNSGALGAGDVIKLAPGVYNERSSPRNIQFDLTLAPQFISNPPTMRGWNAAPNLKGNMVFTGSTGQSIKNWTFDGLIFYARRYLDTQVPGSSTIIPIPGPDGTGYGWRIDVRFDPGTGAAENRDMYGVRIGGGCSDISFLNCVFNGFAVVISGSADRIIVEHCLFEENCEDVRSIDGGTASKFNWNIIRNFRGLPLNLARSAFGWSDPVVPPHSDVVQFTGKTIDMQVMNNYLHDDQARMHGVLLKLATLGGQQPTDTTQFHVRPRIENNLFLQSHSTGMDCVSAIDLICRRNYVSRIAITGPSNKNQPALRFAVTESGFLATSLRTPIIEHNRCLNVYPQPSGDAAVPGTWTWSDNVPLLASGAANPSVITGWQEIREALVPAGDEFAGPYGLPGSVVQTPPARMVAGEYAFDHIAPSGSVVGASSVYIKIPTPSKGYAATSIWWATPGGVIRATVKQGTDGPSGEHIYRLASEDNSHVLFPGQSMNVGVYWMQVDNALMSPRSATDLTVSGSTDPSGPTKAQFADLTRAVEVFTKDPAGGVRSHYEAYLPVKGLAWHKPQPRFTGSGSLPATPIPSPDTPEVRKAGSFCMAFLSRGVNVAGAAPTTFFMQEVHRLEHATRTGSLLVMAGFSPLANSPIGSFPAGTTGRVMSVAFDDVDPADPFGAPIVSTYNGTATPNAVIPATAADNALDRNCCVVIGLGSNLNNPISATPPAGFTLIRDSLSAPHVVMWRSTLPMSSFAGLTIVPTSGSNAVVIGFAVVLRLSPRGFPDVLV